MAKPEKARQALDEFIEMLELYTQLAEQLSNYDFTQPMTAGENYISRVLWEKVPHLDEKIVAYRKTDNKDHK